jgi:hypothetical protein
MGSPCGNNRIEYKINSGHLKPKTEFRFNKKQYRIFFFFEFERSNFSKIKIEIFSTI